MLIASLTLIVSLIASVDNNVYLYYTEDNPSVEFYDCIYEGNFLYCRRPIEPIALERTSQSKECNHNGIFRSFRSLVSNRTNLSTILHQWKSSLEKVEEYARFMKHNQDRTGGFLCECHHPQSFGKYCEYLLPFGTTFPNTHQWENRMKSLYVEDYQYHSDILCYITLTCNSGLLCLDWRDVCDGIQQCLSGYDEENCDKLEFNECEKDEYRCMNGMCIPQEYFLDGDYDCMDLSDEIQSFNDKFCTFGGVTVECDDRLCHPDTWSCGDGQCIHDRLAFQSKHSEQIECHSRRDQYHMCEIHGIHRRWTLSKNGKCFSRKIYHEYDGRNRSIEEECVYFTKCAFSMGTDQNCPCKYDPSCFSEEFESPCPFDNIPYPNGAIVAPYLFFIYNNTPEWWSIWADYLELNATIKCRGYIVTRQMTLPYAAIIEVKKLEALLCDANMVTSAGYDIDCYNNNNNNHSYYFLDVCKQSKECISAYRINDGYQDCADGMDEGQNNLVLKTRSDRFRCSMDESTYLSVHNLGDLSPDCQNNYDEWWMGTDMMLSQMKCNHQSKDDCQLIRQYLDIHSAAVLQYTTRKIPFRTYCDTFWNLGSRKDEDTELCSRWWVCLDDQWQCHSGQCIYATWVLDGEWDCTDASDEESLLFYNHSSSSRNLQVLPLSLLKKNFDFLYGGSKQPFSVICNLSIEYPCFRRNVSEPLVNLTSKRPCISLQQIGDNQIDCLGGIDERNSIQHCNYPTMLGHEFLCVSSHTCIDESDLCKTMCPNPSDNHLLCDLTPVSLDCSVHRHIVCIDGQCVDKNDQCDTKSDCSYGEDQYMCDRSISKQERSIKILYRSLKESMVKNAAQQIQLSQFPRDSTSTDDSSVQSRTLTFTTELNSTSLTVAFHCNRGVGVFLQNGSIICFCPQLYYGDKCQYHNDRLSLILHLNLSQSIYSASTKYTTLLKLLVVFLWANQTLDIHEFHVRPAFEMVTVRKKIAYLLYSRSDQSLKIRRERYFNRSNIINEHPYSVRIELYELNINVKPRLIAVWQYSIDLDYLPAFRLTKILRLIHQEDMQNPCSSSSCHSNQECYPLMNQLAKYICLCSSNFTGAHCSETDESCLEGFCSTHALCKPNYRTVLNGDQMPYCLCPLNHYGRRCELLSDQCLSNPCQNNGLCLPSSQPNQFSCRCTAPFYGDFCELQSQTMTLFMNETIHHEGAVVQYFHLNLFSLELILAHQRAYRRLPIVLSYLHSTRTAPDIVVVKLYSNEGMRLYLISVQFNAISINKFTYLNETNHCRHVRSLFHLHEDISLFKYHSLCVHRRDLLCFIDEIYLCICNENHSRVECFGYDINLDQCSLCLANGQCLKGDRWQTNDFICLCSRCQRGSVCQFNTEIQSFSLDSLLAENNFHIKIIYLSIVTTIVLAGAINNYASLVTFQRPNPFKLGVGRYLFFLSFVNQCSLVFLLIKTMQSILVLFSTDLSCKMISFILSVSTRYTFWLISWVTLDRLYSILFPFSNFLKNSCITYIISSITLIIVAVMHTHELLFYITIQDPHGQTICVANFTDTVSIYNRVTVLTHYMVPFSIQIVSITVLIFLAARTRSRATSNDRNAFVLVLKQQFKNHKELYLTPMIIVLSSLPQVVLAFSFGCNEPLLWQRHALLIVYFLSYAPQLLGFILFVLPSTSYLKEFRETSLSKTCVFKWILPIEKNVKPIATSRQPDNGCTNISTR